MRLTELLSPDRVDVGLVATTKDLALDGVAALLARGAEGLSTAVISRVLRDREALASTGVGDEVAIPHGKVAGLPHLVAAIALCPGGVEFESIDQRPVRIFIAILAPERCAGDHLRALARVSKLLREARVRHRLTAATSASEVLQIIRDEETPMA